MSQATAWSQASVFRYTGNIKLGRVKAARFKKVSKLVQKDFQIIHSGTGKAIGQHRIFTLARDSRFSPEDAITKSIEEAATHFKFDKAVLKSVPLPESTAISTPPAIRFF